MSNVYLNVEQQGDVTVCTSTELCHHIDETNVEDVGRHLMTVIQNAEPPRFVLALPTVEFFGSSFIEAMFRAWNRLNSRPAAKLVLCELQPYCREVVEVTHLDRLWPIVGTREEAVALCSGK